MSEDRRVAEDAVNELEIDLQEEILNTRFRLFLFGVLPVPFFALSGSVFLWPAVSGVLADFATGYILAQTFYAPEDIGSNRRASVPITVLGSVVIFIEIFGV